MTDEEQQFQQREEDLAAAIVANDVSAISALVHDDWVIMGESGHMTAKEDFLAAVKSGALTHSTMDFEGWRIRVYPEAAVASCTARSAGAFQGEDFTTHEASTSVYVKFGDDWLCVLTQLTPIAS